MLTMMFLLMVAMAGMVVALEKFTGSHTEEQMAQFCRVECAGGK